MALSTDQMGNTVLLNGTPKRIISLVPSQTELLFDLGLDEEIVGITKYYVHPKHWLETKTTIGGTKKLNLEKIKELKPDLIIGNKEENEKKQIEELQKLFPVWMSDIKTLDDSLEMIVKVGELAGKKAKAIEIKNNIQKQFSDFKLQTSQNLYLTSTVLYLIWRKPFIAAGKETFINHLLEVCVLKNSLNKIRYPEITPDEIQKANPTYIFLSSEPYPFKEKHFAELQNICPSAKVVLVDGEIFSWYGSRLLHAPSYFRQLLSNLS